MLTWLNSKPKESQTLGQIGEEFAQLHYKNRGYKIVAANFFNKKGLRKGEVDFIAAGHGEIRFVEVKTRAQDTGRFGTALESVNVYKQIKLLKTVKLYLLSNKKFERLIPKIDVFAITVGDFSPLELMDIKPVKYLYKIPLDKMPFSVKIIANAVEDWN